jgi:RHS repeat-associated protein
VPAAVRQAPDDGATSPRPLSILLQDHLGSTVGITGAGTLVSRQKYWPYGTVRPVTQQPQPTGITETDKLYTGQQMEPGDTALGLYNYKARFYSTTLGRFASADSLADAGSLNRYTYADGNSLKYVDPSGHCFNYFDDLPGGGLKCNGYEDLLAWWECALSCDNWIGDLARMGIADWKSGFWGRAFYEGGTLAGDMVLSFIKAIDSNYRRWSNVSGFAWDMIGMAMGVSGRFLSSSLEYMLTGYSAAMMESDVVIGGDLWWLNNSAFGGPIGKGIQDEVLDRLTFKYQFQFFFEDRTLEEAAKLGPEVVNHKKLPWSYGQVHDILPSAGYDAPWDFTSQRYWRTALNVAASGGGIPKVSNWVLPWP